MTVQQRLAVDALLRATPPDPDAPLAVMRAGFAQAQTAPLPADVTARDTELGGLPALELVPDGVDRRGRLLYLHGGGYVVGSARTGAGLATALARRTGTAAVSLDYRLAPEHPFPAAVEDGVAAYRALLADVDPAAALVAGDSAGGGLTIATLVAARDAGLPMPAAAVVFSPFTDLTASGASVDAMTGIDPLFTRPILLRFADHYLAGQDPTAPLASPVRADLTGLPPLLVQVGQHEVLLDDAARLAAAAGAAGVAVTLQVWPGVPHVFQNLTGVLDDADAALDAAGAFLRDALQRPA